MLFSLWYHHCRGADFQLWSLLSLGVFASFPGIVCIARQMTRCSAYVFPALNPFRLTFLRMRESDTTLVAMWDVYFSHPAAPTVKTVPIDVSAHARVNYFVNRRKFVVSEMFYSYLRHYMSSGVHHPAVAKHDNVQ